MAAATSGQLTLTESAGEETGDGSKIRLTCRFCGDTFDVFPSHSDRLYCGQECYGKATRRRVELECERCGDPFEVKKWEADERRFCSRECANPRKQDSKPCPECGDPIEGRPSVVARKKYCSMECYARAQRERVELPCPNCGKPFTVRPFETDSRTYCSRECRDTARRVEYENLTCEHCGDGFEVPPCRSDQRFCSRECVDASQRKGDPSTEPWNGPELTRGQVEIAIENATVGIGQADARPLPGGGGTVRMAVDGGAMSIDAEELTADVGKTDLETVENALAAWADATDMVSLPTAAVEAVNGRREELNEQFGLDLAAVEDVGRAPPEPEPDPDDCDHLDAYKSDDGCLRCDMTAFAAADKQSKKIGSPL